MNVNDYFKGQWQAKGVSHLDCGTFVIFDRIKCADGFSLSVQANYYAYCSPRNSTGPWSKVEVGYPNKAPELIQDYAEDSGDFTDTVYGYVPVELVDQLIALHGGIVASPQP